VSKPIVSGRAERALREIGLTEYESQAYLSLIAYGELTAGAISKSTSIPYSKVYSVLDGLEEKGWVEIKGGRPRLYYPKAPSDALRSELHRLERSFEEHQKLLVSELQPIFEQRKIKEKPEVWIIRGATNIASNINEIVGRTKRELLVALPRIPAGLFQIVSVPLRQLRDQEVRIQLLTTKSSLSQMDLSMLNLAEIRVRAEMFGGGIVADGRETLILLGDGSGDRQALAIWSDNLGLTTIAKVYFDHLWNTAEPYHV